MDSMRNLSTSLPSSSRRRLDQPELLMDFKAAALSVTNLYKSAVSVQAKARAIGYQDALDDLLGFLDKEEMGLMDGEGWRVRRWATERLDEGGVEREGEGSEGEAEQETAKDEVPLAAAGTRSSSPEAQRKAVVPREGSEDSGIIVSEPPVLQLQQQRQGTRSPTPTPPQHTAHQQQQHTVPTAENFTFRSNHTYPSGNHDRARERGTSMEVDTTSQQHMSSSTPPSSSDATLRHYPHPRPSRNHRHTNHNRQRERERGSNNDNGSRAATGTISLNLSANNGKRKMPYPDFFDISGVNFDGNDGRRDGSGNGRGGGGGGGKRGRHV
ncbi:hypothetical protein LTR17_022156 [Elasticomyces elasticus]|nr:hypothetical protein LTR17_022156 [Elasticomyces elasticus]